MKTESKTPAATGVQEKNDDILNIKYQEPAKTSIEIDAILTAPISTFNGTEPEPVGISSTEVTLNYIKSGEYKEKIKWVQAALPDRSEYAKRKKTLPSVTFSCRVTYRGLETNLKNPKSGPHNLISTTHLIALDFDHLADKINTIRQALQSDTTILACFTSPGGEGLKVILYSSGIL